MGIENVFLKIFCYARASAADMGRILKVAVASCSMCRLLLNRLDTFPSAAQPLLPQADTVVASADGQYVTAQTPAHAPGDSIDVENS